MTVHRSLLASLLLLFIVMASRAEDVVTYFDRAAKKNQEVRGTITDEKPTGLTIQAKDGKNVADKTFTSDAILRVYYDTPDVDRLSFRAPFGKEERARGEAPGPRRTALLVEALDGYTKVERAIRGNANARRYLQFKVAEMTALLAQDDPARVDAAIKALADFRTSHPTGWQILPALKMLAALQEDAGKLDDARRSYEALADLPNLPLAVKQEGLLELAHLLLRTGNPAEADKRLKALGDTLSPTDPLTPMVRAYRVAAALGLNQNATVEKDLRDLLKSGENPRLRGLVYNLLGEFHRKNNRLEDAFWCYLRVDTLYNEDPLEHARALYNLVDLFDKVRKDPQRGRDCAARLREARFAGTPYPKMLPRDDAAKP